MVATDRSQPASSPPERVGRYDVLLPIGTGGMATVYLARVRVVDSLYRNVALKLMHPHLRTEDGTWAIQLVEEAKLAGSIRHPNVVPVLEVGEDPHGVFLVMEYVEGDTLAGVIRAARTQKRPLPPPIVARILADALTGLHAAHELTAPNGEPLLLVHRDFSPQNVLVGTDGISRLTDFGIAKVKTRIGVTASGVIKGKVGYMAPEQALGKPLDRRCDVWAAGVVAWELLAMRRLYQDDDQVATLLRLVSNPPPRIRSVCPGVPQEVDDAIASALEVDLTKRCPTALDLKKRLLEAWARIGPTADAEQVGEFVRGLVSAKIEKRAEQAKAVLALRAKISHVSERAIEMASRDGFDSSDLASVREAAARQRSADHSTRAALAVGVGSDPAAPSSKQEVEVRTDKGSSWSRSHRAPAWKRPALGGSIAAVALLAAAGLIAWRIRGGESPLPVAGPDAPSASVPPVDASLTAPDTTVAQTGPSAWAGPAQAKDRPTILVRSDVPMTSLRVGKRTVAMVAATTEVEVQLGEQEWSMPLEVRATALDGRRASVRVESLGDVVEVRFPASQKGGSASSSRKQTSKKAPGLAPPPY